MHSTERGPSAVSRTFSQCSSLFSDTHSGRPPDSQPCFVNSRSSPDPACVSCCLCLGLETLSKQRAVMETTTSVSHLSLWRGPGWTWEHKPHLNRAVDNHFTDCCHNIIWALDYQIFHWFLEKLDFAEHSLIWKHCVDQTWHVCRLILALRPPNLISVCSVLSFTQSYGPFLSSMAFLQA